MIYMDDKKRGYIEIIVGIILFTGILGAGITTIAIAGVRYARAIRYYILSSLVSSLIIGLLIGVLIWSGYMRISDKRK